MENHTPKYHEIVRPLKEVVRGIGESVINKIVPEDVLNGINEVITGQSAQRTAEFFKPPEDN